MVEFDIIDCMRDNRSFSETIKIVVKSAYFRRCIESSIPIKVADLLFLFRINTYDRVASGLVFGFSLSDFSNCSLRSAISSFIVFFFGSYAETTYVFAVTALPRFH